MGISTSNLNRVGVGLSILWGIYFPPDLDLALASFVGFDSLLGLRVTCRAARQRYAPQNRKLWAASSPPYGRGTTTLERACNGGHLEKVQWVVAYFALAMDARVVSDYMLHLSCVRGHLHVAVWLADRLNLQSKNVRAFNNHALHYACMGGHLAVAAWLADRFGLTAEDVRKDDNITLRNACTGGRLAVAIWLTDRFGLKRAADDEALRNACARGHLAVAVWLTNRFGLTTTAAWTSVTRALYIVCVNGHLAIAMWLVAHFGLKTDDVRADSDCDCILRDSCSHGRLAVAVWLTNRFGLMTKDAQAAYNYAPRAACAGGYLAVAVWLADRFDLTVATWASISNELRDFYRDDCPRVITSWLTTRFKRPAACRKPMTKRPAARRKPRLRAN